MSEAEDIERVWDIVGEVRHCMLTTNAGGSLRARPMASYPDPVNECIWFMTDARGGKDDELQSDPRACLAYAEPKTNTFLSISGRANVVRDQEKIDELWNPYAKVFWPDGPADLKIRLICFHPTQAEFWDGPSNPVTIAFRMAKARLTGERPDLGEDKKVAMG